MARWTNSTHVPVSYSEASWTGLLNFRNLQWDETIIKYLKISQSTFPSLVGIDQWVMLGPEYSRKWSSLKEARFFFGISDGVAANIGSKCTDDT